MELTNAQILDFAGSEDIYQKGKELYEANAIVSLDIDDYSNQELILINATLQDHKKYYEVNMAIDKDDITLRASICNCGQSYGCVHSVAVLLRLQHTTKAADKADTSQGDSDTVALQVMNTYESQILFASLAVNFQESIHVEPILEIRQKAIIAITLKVGNDRQYVVKDIRQFMEDIDAHEERSYGKDLTFLHHMQSFDPISQQLLLFMKHHLNDIYYFQAHTELQSAVQARNLCLTPEALDTFFKLYKDQDVMYRIKEKSFINMRFVEDQPPFSIMIKKEDTQTYRLTINDATYHLFEGSDALYILHNYILYRCTNDYAKACLPLLSTLPNVHGSMKMATNIMSTFYHNVIMSIQKYIPIQGDDISEFAPCPLECKVYIDMPRRNVISAKLIYDYGDKSFNALSNTDISASRNMNDEIAVRLVFMKYMTRMDAVEGIAYIENSQDIMYDFLSRGFYELNEICEIYATEQFKKLRIKDKMRISLGVRIESDLLNIEFNTYDFPKDELMDVLQAYRLNKKYYRMKDGSFVNIEDTALLEFSSILDGVQISEHDLHNGSIQLPKYRSLYIDSTLKDTNMIQVERDQSFKNIIRDMKSVQDSDYEVPKSLKSTLRNYQKVGFRWLKTIADYGFGGILADDMGIGKTLQVITLLEDEKQRNPDAISLVVCPSSLILNWQDEIDKFSKQLSACIVSGSIEERKTFIQRSKDFDVMITSYDYLKRDIEYYSDINFTYEVIDEAQFIKNHQTKNALSVKAITAKHRFALTGTPIENSLAELWSMFDYLMTGYLFTYPYFKKHYEIPIVRDNDQGMLRELKRMVDPFILRRVKKDVLKELPEKVEKTMLVELDEETRKLYMANVQLVKEDIKDKIQQKGVASSRFEILSMITRLRQLCCDPRMIYENIQTVGSKVKACMEYIQTCQEAGKKVLLFSQFTSLLSLMEKELHHEHIPYYLLKGSTPKQLRQQYVNAFNADHTPVFLISLKAGGTGLNLTSAEVVIHFDPWWNVSAQNQASDRAYRIGQHNNVQVIKLITKDTIEEKILQLQEQKQGLSDSIIHQNEGVITQMSKDQIMDLFD